MERATPYLKKYSILIIIVVILVVLGVAYELGYRVGPGVTLSRVGTLTISGLPANATIYTDQSPRGTSKKAGSMTFDLVGGNHMVMVGTLADYPWSELVNISAGMNTEITPLLVSTSTKGSVLTGSAQTQALAAIASTTLPTVAHPLRMGSGCELVYVANNQLIADATSTPGCTPPTYLCIGGKCASTIIFSPLAPLSTVLPYPGRQDAVLVGLEDSLYALSLDPRSPQFFAPIVEATVKPKFGELSNGTLVTFEASSTFSLSL